MLKHLSRILLLLVFLIINQTIITEKIKKPEDVFPVDPQYRPTINTISGNNVKNPFSDTYNREDPDALFLGFFPIWSAILACVALIFGFIALFGLIGYCSGCRNPNRPLMKKQKPPKVPIYFHDEYEDAALKMIDTPDNDYEKSFKNSRLTSLA